MEKTEYVSELGALRGEVQVVLAAWHSGGTGRLEQAMSELERFCLEQGDRLDEVDE